jgi:hypothetical protein
MTFTTIKDRKTGEIKTAVLGVNKFKNLRMAVDGKFYADKEFNRRFEVLNQKSI